MIKKIFKLVKLEYAIFIIFSFYLTISFFFIPDPDFGWHIKTGELILKKGIPKVDWFTHTMPNFPWIDHEWLTNISMYKLYSLLGYFGLALISALIVSIILIVIIPKIKRVPFKFYVLPLILGFFEITRFYGVRPQILTGLFLGIYWLIFNKFSESKNFKILWLFPISMVFWVNLHGSFFLGIIILAFALLWQFLTKTKLKGVLFKFFQLNPWKKKEIKYFCFILFVTLLVTFLNPYGYRIYEEVFRTIGDSSLRFFINEWWPIPLRITIYGIFYIFFFVIISMVNRKKIDGFSFCITYFLLLITILNQRYFPLFFIFSVPLIAESIFVTLKDKQKFKNLKTYPLLVNKVAFGLFVLFFLIIIFTETASNLLLWDFLPKGDETQTEGLRKYLTQNSLDKKMFNDYNIGGMLIWKIPEKRVFIDGRMPSWEKDNIKILDEETQVIHGNFEEILKKYDVKQVILNNNFEVNVVENSENQGLRQKIEKIFFDYREKRFSIPNKALPLELNKSGWKTAYYDDFYVVFEKD